MPLSVWSGAVRVKRFVHDDRCATKALRQYQSIRNACSEYPRGVVFFAANLQITSREPSDITAVN